MSRACRFPGNRRSRNTGTRCQYSEKVTPRNVYYYLAERYLIYVGERVEIPLSLQGHIMLFPLNASS